MPAAAMMTRPIPSTGEAMPVIGLGTWRAFDVGSDETGRRPLRQVLQRLLDDGGRIIDTSPMYGRAEEVTGDLLAESGARPRSFLATKVWTTGRERGIEQMRRSAQLLRTEVIDLVQIHNLVDWRTHLATLRRMKEEGGIRYIGITHYTTGALPALARILVGAPRSSSPSHWSEAICFAACAGAPFPIGSANSTARAGRSCSSNTFLPSP